MGQFCSLWATPAGPQQLTCSGSGAYLGTCPGSTLLGLSEEGNSRLCLGYGSFFLGLQAVTAGTLSRQGHGHSSGHTCSCSWALGGCRATAQELTWAIAQWPPREAL